MAAELFFCDFPIYTVSSVGQRQFYIAGGGGQAKTGVPNVVEIHTLSINGTQYTSKCTIRHNMDSQLVMNSSAHPSDLCTLAVGIGDSCHILQMTNKGRGGKDTGVEELKQKEDKFLKDVSSARTDFNGAESYQKVVRFSHDGTRLVTGGTEGVVRVWKYPGLKEVHKLMEHKKEIEDIACHPSEMKAVSVCRAGAAVVWDLKKGEQIKNFTWIPSKQTSYRFRACCFSPQKGKGGKQAFYSLNVPLKWNHRAKQHCYLTKWDVSNWELVAAQSVGRELLCAMTIDSTGDRIAVGSTEGSVAIYNKGLELLKKVNKVHSVFVTCLAFVSVSQPQSQKKQQVRPTGQEVLLSVSVDRTCSVTDTTARNGWCNMTVILFLLMPLVIVVIAVFYVWLFIA